ncbi:hypothetical protein HY636_01795 [Candidatus Woesearchaeota archaeon]|nr:hypothetical protein [Candidatus Woesearchaeota archaeon]
MNEMKVDEIRYLVERLNPSPRYGYGTTYEPVFPSHRKDICAIVRSTRTALSLDRLMPGMDFAYFFWYEKGLNYKEIVKSAGYLEIEDIIEDDINFVVRVKGRIRWTIAGPDCAFNGLRTYKIKKSELTTGDFEEWVQLQEKCVQPRVNLWAVVGRSYE